MPKETTGQKETVGRVMHEYKHGELESGTGQPVKSRGQAVAIALHEAGASNQESPEKNRENLKRTKKKEREGKTAKQHIRCGGITFKIGFFRARVWAEAGTEDERLCKVTGIGTVSYGR
ncbi:MAG: DUF6496 domain-containing protein, partial [Rhodomicrobium sp.]